jgi:hypothetical protein
LNYHSVVVVLTLIQTKPIRINIHKRNNTKHRTNNTKDNKYKYTYYQNTHPLQNTHIHIFTHYKTHTYTTNTLQNTHIHIPTHYKTHTLTHTHTLQNTHIQILPKHPPITKPTHTHTHTLQNPHTHTHPHITKPTHTHTHILQNKLKQPHYKIHTNEIVTIQSCTLSMMPP